MEPTLYEKDLAVVLAQDEYALGDVVAFRVEGGIVIHRIVGGDPQAGYITRGDNREFPDMWRPKPADIVGRLVLRLPGAGRWLEWLREPPAFSALASGLAAASLATAEPRPPRRRGGRRAGPGPVRPLPDLAWGVLIVAGLGVLAFGALAFFAFRQPLREQVPVERARYEHSAAFSYVVQVQPSFLYPEGIFGPVRPTPGARPPAVLPPSPFGNRPQPPSGAAVFTRLARRLELDVDYALRSDLPAELTGRYWAVVEVGSGPQGWVRTLEAVPPTEFQGGAASFKVAVDFGQIWSVIDAVERETEYRPGSYEVRVVPTIQVSGRVGSEPVDDTFAPPFTLRLDRARIILDGELVRSEPRAVTEVAIREARLRLPGPLAGAWNPPVNEARTVGLAGALISLAVGGAGRGGGVSRPGAGRGGQDPSPLRLSHRHRQRRRPPGRAGGPGGLHARPGQAGRAAGASHPPPGPALGGPPVFHPHGRGGLRVRAAGPGGLEGGPVAAPFGGRPDHPGSGVGLGGQSPGGRRHPAGVRPPGQP